jgi:hypothetical protein
MRKHIHDRSNKSATIPLTAEERNFPRTKVELPPREMRELFVISQILNQKTPASEAALDSLLTKGLKSEALRELLAEACLKWKRAEPLKQQLGALIASNTENPGVYVLKSEMLFSAQVPKITFDARLGDAAVEMRALARKALEIAPNHPAALTQLAWTEALGAEVTPENIAALEKMVRNPARASTHDVIAALAIAYWRAGNSEGARRVAESLIKSPFVPPGPKAMASSLLRELDGAP